MPESRARTSYGPRQQGSAPQRPATAHQGKGRTEGGTTQQARRGARHRQGAPALSSQLVPTTLASSIRSFIPAQELSGVTVIVEQRTFRGFESCIVATVPHIALALLPRFLGSSLK